MCAYSALAALEPGCTAIAVDPDTSGAIAIVHLERANAMWTVCTTLHDMPLVEVPIGRRFRRYKKSTICITIIPLPANQTTSIGTGFRQQLASYQHWAHC